MTGKNNHVVVFIPALANMLVKAEDWKRSPLTEAEVIAIRDKASVIMMDPNDAREMEKKRGFRDLDPENVWWEWQELRNRLGRKPAISAGAKVNQIRKDDAAMLQASIDARASLGRFRELIQAVNRGQMRGTPMVKTRLIDGENAAFMWLADARELDAGGFEGELFEVPSTWKNRKVGEKFIVANKDIADWMLNDNGRLHGGFSLRVVRERKPPNERPEFDRYVGVTSYVPLPKPAN